MHLWKGAESALCGCVRPFHPLLLAKLEAPYKLEALWRSFAFEIGEPGQGQEVEAEKPERTLCATRIRVIKFGKEEWPSG